MYYDYLVIALGSETKFFGMSDIQRNAFTIKTLNDAINLRNHIIYLLEQCDQLLLSAVSTANIDNIYGYTYNTKTLDELQKKLLTFVIVGGGFAGVQVLRKIQDAFENDVSVDISLVSRDNFFLFTPMLPEISSGMIESRHIATPVRSFCKRARFYEANVELVDLQNKQVVITHLIGNHMHNQHHQPDS